MLSVIICSRNPGISEPLKENIHDSIGIPHEIIVIDNQGCGYSLAAAYNKGASEAEFELLCFVHEDVLFRTNNWGNLIHDHLIDPMVGVIGVAGSTYYPDCPAIWANEASNTRQHFKNGNQSFYNNPHDEILSEVITVDGLMICCRKEVWVKSRFDENIGGFHFYDLDFCFSARANGWKNYIIYDVLLEHASWGNFSADWIERSLLFYKKWQTQLPIYVSTISREETIKIQQSKVREFIHAFCNYAIAEKGFLIKFMTKNLHHIRDTKTWLIALRYLLLGNPKSHLNRHIAAAFSR